MRQGCPQVAHSGVPQGSREDYSEAARLPPPQKNNKQKGTTCPFVVV
jgi:hypothetical protein